MEGERRRFWSRPSVVPPFKRSLMAYGVLIVPAVLAALLAWPWWLGCVLLIPGLTLHLKAGRMAAVARGMTSPDKRDRGIGGMMGALVGVTFPPLADAHPNYAALFFVCYLIFLVDPIWRLVYRHRGLPSDGPGGQDGAWPDPRQPGGFRRRSRGVTLPRKAR